MENAYAMITKSKWTWCRRHRFVLTCIGLALANCAAKGQTPGLGIFPRGDESTSRTLEFIRQSDLSRNGPLDVSELQAALKIRYKYIPTWPGRDTMPLTEVEQAARQADRVRLMTAIRRAGIHRILEKELEEALLRTDDPDIQNSCLWALQLIRGRDCGAANVRYLNVKQHPDVRANLYYQIALSAGDALTTLSAHLEKSSEGRNEIMATHEAATIIRAMGWIPTTRTAQSLMKIYDNSSSQSQLRGAALTALGNLGIFIIPKNQSLAGRTLSDNEFAFREGDRAWNYNQEAARDERLTSATCAQLRSFVLLHAEDPSEVVRRAVVDMAKFMATTDAYRTLATMAEKDQSPKVREAAAKSKQELDKLLIVDHRPASAAGR